MMTLHHPMAVSHQPHRISLSEAAKKLAVSLDAQGKSADRMDIEGMDATKTTFSV